MRYAILSDIHANRQALKAVLTDARGIGVDRIIALGDLVGYGPSPAEVLETSYAAVNFFLLGNHDAVCSGQLPSEYFNDEARAVIEWTRGVVDRKVAEFFAAMPLMLEGEGCRFTHGNFTDPGRFGYIIDREEALANFQATIEPLLFAGHSHMPGIYVIGESGRPHWLPPQDFMVEEGKRFIVNAGSVGQPRDHDTRASYCLYDPGKGEVRFRKVPFDLDAYREDVKRAGISASASYFLALEAGRPARPLREIIDFRVVSAKDSVKTADDIRSLTAAAHGYRRLRLLVVLLLVLLLAGAATLAWLQLTGRLTRTEVVVQKETQVIREAAPSRHVVPATETRPAGLPQVEEELLSMPSPTGGVTLETPLPTWAWDCDDPVTQRISVESDPAAPEEGFFRLFSGVARPVDLECLPVPAEKGMRFTAQAQFKRIALRAGFVEVQFEHELPDGTRRVLGRATPRNFGEKTVWVPVSYTVDAKQPLDAGGLVRYRIHGEFQGEVLVRKCSLRRKE